MTDLPSRERISTIMEKGGWETIREHVRPTEVALDLYHTLWGFAAGNLLTRAEAADDAEVQRIVVEKLAYSFEAMCGSHLGPSRLDAETCDYAADDDDTCSIHRFVLIIDPGACIADWRMSAPRSVLDAAAAALPELLVSMRWCKTHEWLPYVDNPAVCALGRFTGNCEVVTIWREAT